MNKVGVNLNTASASLLSYVAGIGPTLAKRVVAHRDDKGGFTTRKQLMDVSGIGARTFEQAAGFLRIQGGKNPLDTSAVHPERYKVVEHMAKSLGVTLQTLVGNAALVDRIAIAEFAASVGEMTDAGHFGRAP